MNPFSSVSIVLLLVFHKNLLPVVASVEKTCRDAAQRNPLFDYNFCVDNLNKDPRSATAGILELAEIAADESVSSATEAHDHISEILNDKLNPPDQTTNSILLLCLVKINDAGQSALDAFVMMKAVQLKDAQTKLIASLDDSNSCESAFSQVGKTSPITKENKEFSQMLLISLSILNLVVG